MIKDIFSNKLQKNLSDDEFIILQDKYEPEKNLSQESIFSLSNGYLGVRGAFEEGVKSELPCTFVNGVFDKSETFMRELANLPNWLDLKLYVEKELISVEDCKIDEFARVLDMKTALVARKMVVTDANGRKTLVEIERFVSRNNVHRMALRYNVTPLNYSGILEIENIIDGSVINFADAPRFKVKHTKLIKNCKLSDDGAYVEVTTRDRGLNVGVGSKVQILKDDKEVFKTRTFGAFGETAIEFLDCNLIEGQSVEIIKYVSIYTQREIEQSAIQNTIKNELEQFIKDGFQTELDKHKKVYENMWSKADIQIQGDFELNRAIRFNIFHLMSTASENDDRVNVGAKLLSGEEYGGHAFWDTELFMLPFFTCVFPKTARNLESYRYNLLEAAIENAKKNGYNGAQYPWESADDGTEQCPDWTILPDGSCYRCHVAEYEHHVTGAVAYGIYNYVKTTNDIDFLHTKGAEILIQTARFWVSRCEYNEKFDRYEINNVTGPDEWHEPVNNNLYTNYLSKWNINFVLDLLKTLKKENIEVYYNLKDKLDITQEELDKWSEVQAKIYLPTVKENGILEQFEGYFDLIDVTIEEYDENDWPIRPKIFNEVTGSSCPKRADTQVIKQADVVMLMHLLGDEFDFDTKVKNYHYYEKRALHGSSLSPSIYSIMGLKVGDESKAYRYLKRAAFIDLIDLQKNTREGIHAANAGGVWQTVVFGFAGVNIDDKGEITVNPKMPKEWESLSFNITVRGTLYNIYINNKNEVKLEVL